MNSSGSTLNLSHGVTSDGRTFERNQWGCSLSALYMEGTLWNSIHKYNDEGSQVD